MSEVANNAAIARVIECERVSLKRRLQEAAVQRGHALREKVQLAVEEAATDFHLSIVDFDADTTNGKVHENRRGVVFKLQFDNDCTISYEYSSKYRNPYLHLYFKQDIGMVDFTPEMIDEIADLKEFFPDKEKNDFSTLEDRMCAYAWKQCAICFCVYNVEEFSQKVFDFYVKMLSLVHPKRDRFSLMAFTPFVFRTKQVTANVCVRSDIELQVPTVSGEVALLVDQEEKCLYFDNIPPIDEEAELAYAKPRSAEDADKAQIVEYRLSQVRIELQQHFEDMGKYQNAKNPAVGIAYQKKKVELEKEGDDLEQILVYLKGGSVRSNDKIIMDSIQSSSWLADVNERVSRQRDEQEYGNLNFEHWKYQVDNGLLAQAEQQETQASIKAAADAADAVANAQKRKSIPRLRTTQTDEMKRKSMILADMKNAAKMEPTLAEIARKQQRIQSIDRQISERANNSAHFIQTEGSQEAFDMKNAELRRERNKVKYDLDALQRIITNPSTATAAQKPPTSRTHAFAADATAQQSCPSAPVATANVFAAENEEDDVAGNATASPIENFVPTIRKLTGVINQRHNMTQERMRMNPTDQRKFDMETTMLESELLRFKALDQKQKMAGVAPSIPFPTRTPSGHHR